MIRAALLIAPLVLLSCRARPPVEPLHSPYDVTQLAARTRAGDVTVVDLSLALDAETPYYPEGDPFTSTRIGEWEKDGYYANRFAMGEHTGTHIDAPCHFVKGKWAIDDLPLSHLIAPCVVVDVEERAKANADYAVTVYDLEAWEKAHGRIPDGAVVLMRSGWSKKAKDLAKYRNLDKNGTMHFPAFSREAAEWLVRERAIVGIGVDTLSGDLGPSKDYAVHHVVLGAQAYILEDLANLDRVPEAGAVLVVSPLKIRGGSGSPVRVYALIGKS